MDNFGEVIYILIFAIIIIKGLFDSIQKRAAKEETPLPSFDPEQTPQEPKALKELRKMFDIPDDKEEEEDNDHTLQETTANNSNLNDFLKDKQEEAVYYPEFPKVEKKKTQTKTKTQQQQNIREFVKLKDANDLKRAVIYSEILNRKF